MKHLTLTLLFTLTFGFISAKSKILLNNVLNSESLNREVSYGVYLPDCYTENETYHVLYLLHGLGDNFKGWTNTNQGNIQQLTDSLVASNEALKMVVIMPDAYDSWYINQYDGKFNYEEMFFTELMPEIERKFSVSKVADSTHIAGLSMGGNGSLIYVMKHPGRFKTCFAMSPAAALPEMFKGWLPDLYGRLFGNDPENKYYNENNVIELAKKLPLPYFTSFYIDCGDKDFLYEGVSTLYITMRKNNIPLEYRIRSGDHNWVYWRDCYVTALKRVNELCKN